MSVNFAIIFLALLIGVVIGYEVGSYRVRKHVNEFLGKISEEMMKTAKIEEERRKTNMKELLEFIDKAKTKEEHTDEQHYHTSY